MACRLIGAKPLSEPLLDYGQLNPCGTNFNEIGIKIQPFSYKKMSLKVSFAKMAVIFSRPQCVDASNCQLTNISTICDIPVSRINSSPHVQNSRRFADDISERIFMNENVWIWIKISLKVVPMGLIDNKWALVRVMAWRWSGDKPFSETVLTRFTDVYMRH